MDQFNELITSWQETSIDSAEGQNILINKQNHLIMNSIILYGNKTKEKTRNAKTALKVIIAILPIFLLFYALLTYFRGSEVVTYNLAEMIIGIFLLSLGFGLIYYVLNNQTIPTYSDTSTKKYLIELRESLIKDKKTAIPYFIMFMLLIPLGLALFLKSVFMISIMNIVIPFGIYMIILVMLSYLKEGPKQKKVMTEIEALLSEFDKEN